MDDSFFNRIFSAAAGVWAIVGMVAVALFKTWPLVLGRFNERRRDDASERAIEWEHLRDDRDSLAVRVAERDRQLAERDILIDALRLANAELLGAKVIAEAKLVAQDSASGRPTLLPGMSTDITENGSGE